MWGKHLELIPSGPHYVTANGAFLLRHPRREDAKASHWVWDLAGDSIDDDWALLNHSRELQKMFSTTEEALCALAQALDAQVRQGEVWIEKRTKERYVITQIERDPTISREVVYVKSLDSNRSFSPGDFQKRFRPAGKRG